MFATGFVARTLAEIADLSSGWRRDCIGVVAVACDMQVKSFEWTRKALRTLAPSYVGLVANASSKPEDLVMIASLIGGVDSLLVEGLNETMTPLSALSCDIPVSHLDGMTANAGTWRDAFEATLDLDSRS